MRIFLFICAIVLLIIGWCLGWFLVADRVETAITQVKQRFADNGQTLDCENQQLDGFPFRISLNCTRFVYVNPDSGVSLTTDRLKSAAQAYQPNKLVAEIESPANLALNGNDNFLTEWESLRTSMSAGLSGPSRFSLAGRNLRIIPEQTSQPTLEIVGLQIHSRRNGDEAVDYAMSIDDATTAEKPWPDYDLNLDVRFDDIYSDLLRRTDFLEIAKAKGLKGEIYNLKYEALSGGSATLKGPMEIDRNGLLSGKFQVTVSELPALLTALARAFPEQQGNIQTASSVLESIAGSNKDAEFKVPVIVKNGKIIVGIFPVGEVPPLY